MENDANVSLRLPGATPIRRQLMPAREFARIWESLPHLTPEEAELIEGDIRAARDSYPPEVDPWA